MVPASLGRRVLPDTPLKTETDLANTRASACFPVGGVLPEGILHHVVLEVDEVRSPKTALEQATCGRYGRARPVLIALMAFNLSKEWQSLLKHYDLRHIAKATKRSLRY
jgi:hypothetical protein